jgi:hypothetical protein
MPPELSVHVPESVTVSAAARAKCKLLAVAFVCVELVVTVTFAPDDQVSFV